MYYERHSHCIDCEDCIKDPSNLHCNILCGDTSKNCYESCKVFNPKVYAKAYIVRQPYECLFDLEMGFVAGTIFQNLYSPYCATEYSKECKYE